MTFQHHFACLSDSIDCHPDRHYCTDAAVYIFMRYMTFAVFAGLLQRRKYIWIMGRSKGNWIKQRKSYKLILVTEKRKLVTNKILKRFNV